MADRGVHLSATGALNGTHSAERMPHLERYWSAADPDYCDGEGAESFRALLRRCDAALARFAAIPPASLVYVFGMGSSSRPRARSSPTPL
ncbi:phosphoglycerate mutase (plasmid) [Sphingobium sp. TKS]|uniref:Broad specificity phosphatase PhoE n=1 Tax=Sphingobium scionense TaxID=1404341 RepID=A0A7W6LWR2_9SPHN|nr:phosphoglycerate mutase [Sphingobium sp. TKS]MBB4151577.1 broad specificity phosphatase PhoE [Sphingobium scionense]MBB4151581.1 broad specificity phosphatase PhoE [Sphingobium scionense]